MPEPAALPAAPLEIYDYIQAECQRRGMEVHISLIHEGEPEAPDEAHDLHLKKSGCHGFCEMGPLLQIEPDGILYTHVHLEDCDEIIEKTLLQGELIPRLLYQLDGVTYAKHEEIPFYHKQQRVVLENCGTTDARRTSTSTSPGTATPPSSRRCLK